MFTCIRAVVLAVVTFGAIGGPAATFAQGTPAATPGPDGGIPPLVWELTEAALADGSVTEVDEPARYTVQFLPDGAVVGTADCNAIGGEYELAGSALTIGPLRSTLVGCPADSLGEQYSAWLSQVTQVEVGEDALVLGLADGGTLRFAPSLLGVVWEWQSFAGGNDSVVTAADPTRYTLQFESAMSVLVVADCNRGRADVAIAAPQLTIGPVALTRMACPPGSQATEFVRYLEDAASFLIVDGKLALALKMDAGIATFSPRVVSGEATPLAGTPATD